MAIRPYNQIEENIMCTMISETVKVEGSAKGVNGWFKVEQANVSFDHPFSAPYEHALNIDFVDQSQGLSNRAAVELSHEAARELVKTILAVLDQAESEGQITINC
jgi:uncharacterized protein DUF6295